eukprot:13392894-Alexandrium_andersonii.AAC.1
MAGAARSGERLREGPRRGARETTLAEPPAPARATGGRPAGTARAPEASRGISPTPREGARAAAGAADASELGASSNRGGA